MKLLAEIDGATIPLDRCFWVATGPTGCAFASMVGGMASTDEQAHERLTPKKRERDREIKSGVTVQLLSPERWDAEAKPCFLGQCDHPSA